MQVPVSLIERLTKAIGEHLSSPYCQAGVESDEMLWREATALLSQPTPTAKTRQQRAQQVIDRNQRNRLRSQPPATPPRIEDMAPGTTFVDPLGERWTILQDRSEMRWAESDSGDEWDIEYFDPSRIRDVTPPAGA
jgi:hypothetical protein